MPPPAPGAGAVVAVLDADGVLASLAAVPQPASTAASATASVPRHSKEGLTGKLPVLRHCASQRHLSWGEAEAIVDADDR